MWYDIIMICTKCKQDKDGLLFSNSKSRKNGKRVWCKLCEKTAVKHWHSNNRTKASAYMRKYYKKNKKKIKDYVREYNKNRRHTDLEYRLLINLRRRLHNAIRGYSKSKRTLALLGCSVPELIKYLEKLFKPGMSWDNYGKWHIDHRIPCAYFDFSKIEDQYKCFNYTNLQPLWAQDNLHKSATLISSSNILH